MTLKKSYEEIMERVVVTDEMKTRILARIQSEACEASPVLKSYPSENISGSRPWPPALPSS